MSQTNRVLVFAECAAVAALAALAALALVLVLSPPQPRIPSPAPWRFTGFPIVGYWLHTVGTPPTTAADARLYRDAGFTVMPCSNAESLAAAQEVGLPIMSFNEVREIPGTDRVAGPLVVARYVLDEPRGREEMDRALDRAVAIETSEPGVRAIVNLVPPWVSEHPLEHEPWRVPALPIEEAFALAARRGISVLAFDDYSLARGDEAAFRADLERVAAASKTTGVAFWATALATGHGTYPRPSAELLRRQVRLELEAGASGLWYFYYRSPKGYGFGPGLVDFDGRPTPLYAVARELNAEIATRTSAR